MLKALAIKLVEIRRFLRVEHVPIFARLDAAHEFVGKPCSGVGGAHTQIVVAGVVLPVDELREVIVPVLHVETERALLLAAALDSADRSVDDLGEGRRAA